jgi:hypothetical protein
MLKQFVNRIGKYWWLLCLCQIVTLFFPAFFLGNLLFWLGIVIIFKIQFKQNRSKISVLSVLFLILCVIFSGFIYDPDFILGKILLSFVSLPIYLIILLSQLIGDDGNIFMIFATFSSILSLTCLISALVSSVISLIKIKKNPELGNKGTSIIVLTVSVLLLIYWGLSFVFQG